MKSRFVSAAEEEFLGAAAFYETKQRNLGEDFISRVLDAIGHLEKAPLLGTPARESVRSFPIRQFPFTIVYRVNPDEIVIYAVRHQSRRPNYWIGRIID